MATMRRHRYCWGCWLILAGQHELAPRMATGVMFFKTLCLYTDIYTNKGYQYIISVLIHVLNISGSHGALQLCEQMVDNSKVESKESFRRYNFSLGVF
jgi:hypothetical protein